LKWARKNHCPWNEKTCYKAAQNGHLNILQWARENYCKWDLKTCYKASKRSHLEVLQWAINNGCPYNINVPIYAASFGRASAARSASFQYFILVVQQIF
jgi:hypothetical protein